MTNAPRSGYGGRHLVAATESDVTPDDYSDLAHRLRHPRASLARPGWPTVLLEPRNPPETAPAPAGFDDWQGGSPHARLLWRTVLGTELLPFLPFPTPVLQALGTLLAATRDWLDGTGGGLRAMVEAAPAVVDAATADPDTELRSRMALLAVAMLTEPMAPPVEPMLLTLLGYSIAAATHAAARHAARVVPVRDASTLVIDTIDMDDVMQHANSRDATLGAAAIRALGWQRDERSTDYLHHLLQRGEPWQWSAAIDALGTLGTRTAADLLVAELQRAADDEQLPILRAMRPWRAIRILLTWMQDSDVRRRTSAVRMIAHWWHYPLTSSGLLQLLEHERWNVRLAAALGIEQLGVQTVRWLPLDLLRERRESETHDLVQTVLDRAIERLSRTPA